MHARIVLALCSLALVVVGAVVVVALRPASHGAPAAGGRTVIVVARGARLPAAPFFALRDCVGRPTTCANGAGGKVLVYGMGGNVPAKRVAATVLTDANCQPDRDGVSHCINALQLAGGAVLTVRHDHDMGNDPCLTPGEHVFVRLL